MVENYNRLSKLIDAKEKHTLAFWVNLVTKTMEEIDQEVVNQPGVEAVYSFQEFQDWARSLGDKMGWGRGSTQRSDSLDSLRSARIRLANKVGKIVKLEEVVG